jgi:hypothetical protein
MPPFCSRAHVKIIAFVTFHLITMIVERYSEHFAV